MTKKAFFLLLTVAVLIVSIGGMGVHAQSVPCGTAGGPACTPEPAFQDRDSDTVDDANDACPDTFGDPANRGCPVESAAATSTPVPSAPLPGFPADNERCLIATFGDPVNIRQAPDLNAPVVGQLQPGEFAVVLQKVIIIDQLWYRIALGYVSGSVVRFNEPCDRVVPTVQTFPRAAYMKIGDIKGEVSSEGAPPPSFDCYRYVIIDGNVLCLQSLPPTFTGMGGSSEGAPPPDTSCWYGVVVNGNFICLMRTEPMLTGLAPVGGTDGLPPPDTSCYYQVLVDGSFICLISTPPEFGLPPGSSEAPPPPEPGTCYHLVIHEGQAYCLVSIPPVLTTDQGGTEGAPPPDPTDCAYYVIYQGSVVCLVNEDTGDRVAPSGTGDPIPQTREHILLAFNPPADPDACPQTTGLLLPAVQSAREAARRASASELEMTPLMVLPPADPCAFEIMVADPNVPPTPTDDGGMQYEVDIIRIIPPTDPPPRPLPFGAPEEEGANEGAKCYSDDSGFFGCTVGFGGYSFSAYYDPQTGGHTETCVPTPEGGVSCS